MDVLDSILMEANLVERQHVKSVQLAVWGRLEAGKCQGIFFFLFIPLDCYIYCYDFLLVFFDDYPSVTCISQSRFCNALSIETFAYFLFAEYLIISSIIYFCFLCFVSYIYVNLYIVCNLRYQGTYKLSLSSAFKIDCNY